MPVVAILTAVQPRSDLPALPRAALQAGGISLIERQARQLRRVGVSSLFIIADPALLLDASVRRRLEALRDMVVVASALELVAQLADDDVVVMVQEGGLVDQRILAAILGCKEVQALATFPPEAPQFSASTRIDARHGFAAVLKADGETVRHVCRGLGDWDLMHTLLRAIAAEAELVDAASLETPRDPLQWQFASAGADEPNLQAMLLDTQMARSQTALASWIARPAWRLALDAALPRGLRPWMVWSAALLLWLTCLGFMLKGWSWPGLLSLLLAGWAFGLGQQCARLLVLQEDAPAGLRATALLAEIIAWGAFGSAVLGMGGALGWWLLLCVCMLCTAWLRGLFKALTAASLTQGRAIDSLPGQWGSALPVNVLLVSVCLLTGHPALGLPTLAGLAIVTFLLTLWRFSQRLARFVAKQSQSMAANVSKSALRRLLSSANPLS